MINVNSWPQALANAQGSSIARAGSGCVLWHVTQVLTFLSMAPSIQGHQVRLLAKYFIWRIQACMIGSTSWSESKQPLYVTNKMSEFLPNLSLLTSLKAIHFLFNAWLLTRLSHCGYMKLSLQHPEDFQVLLSALQLQNIFCREISPFCGSGSIPHASAFLSWHAGWYTGP